MPCLYNHLLIGMILQVFPPPRKPNLNNKFKEAGCNNQPILRERWEPSLKLSPKDPITLSDDEQGVYNHLRNGRHLGSMKPFSEGETGSLGKSKFAPEK